MHLNSLKHETTEHLKRENTVTIWLYMFKHEAIAYL